MWHKLNMKVNTMKPATVKSNYLLRRLFCIFVLVLGITTMIGCSGSNSDSEGDDDPVVGDDDPVVSVFINAESGNARSLDGTWIRGCDEPADIGETDESENWVFLGDTFERQEAVYTSTDGNCSTGEDITTTHTGTVAVQEDFITDGWGDGDGPLAAPMRLDSTGSLNLNPTVTKLVITIPTGPDAGDLHLFFYMDDTATPWHLYREGEDDHSTFSNLVHPEEPMRKV